MTIMIDETYLELLEAVLPEGWAIDDVGYGVNAKLICPCDHVIEMDGECPNGHRAPPLQAAGQIAEGHG
jgi:hypothetical protein